MRKQLILVGLLPFLLGGALAAKTAGSKVVPLSASDKARAKCPLHGAALRTENVSIAYGLMGALPGYFEAQKKTFPFANSVVLGGCIVSKDSPTTETVKFCPKCRAVQKRWVAAHKNAVFSPVH